MSSCLCLVLLLAGVCAVLSYPYSDDQYYPDSYYAARSQDLFNPQDDIGVYLARRPYQDMVLSKRGLPTSKRATLNQLLQRLIALYGSNDITYSGRTSHMRFGAGRRRR